MRVDVRARHQLTRTEIHQGAPLAALQNHRRRIGPQLNCSTFFDQRMQNTPVGMPHDGCLDATNAGDPRLVVQILRPTLTVDATFPEVAEPLDGPVCQELAKTARRHGIALVAGAWWKPRKIRARPTTPGGFRARRRPARLLPENPPLRCPGLRGIDVHQAVDRSGGVRLRRSAIQTHDLLRPAVPGAGQVAGRRRRSGRAGLLVLGAGHP